MLLHLRDSFMGDLGMQCTCKICNKIILRILGPHLRCIKLHKTSNIMSTPEIKIFAVCQNDANMYVQHVFLPI